VANNNLYNNMGLSDFSYLLDPSAVDAGQTMGVEIKNAETTLKIADLVPFRNHPFHVDTESEDFQQLVESIRENGVIYPVLVRPMDDKYEIIAGHCRVAASKMAGLNEIPAICKVMDDYEATIIMVHTNINGRGKILLSEKAKAYRMCMDAEKHQGRKGVDTAVMVGNGQDSKRQVYRFVRLSYLSDDFLRLLDDGKLPVTTGHELAYLDARSQEALYTYIEQFKKYPSMNQASKLRELYEVNHESLSFERIVTELTDAPKIKAATKVSFKTKQLADYFDDGTDAEQMSNVILMLLTKYRNGEIELND
jgi:ParB family chromosome partitioning protein